MNVKASQRRVTKVGKTNALEIRTRSKFLNHQSNASTSSIKAAPVASLPLPADIFPKLGTEAKVLQDRFEAFIQGMSIHAYVELLLKAYFKSILQCQGQIDVFVEPLHDLYEL
ncbi:uncharacterized protein ARMOST_04298 [Armillaria ostoyae]|uniref:Uncharacterized protein n=1 Tax=Armillaria ostoyae TaxID=47428 RepID=A0A284QX00_ARMOS|nr:uncharacterized protein ARMOST_04298 [Armillaria ostoyae]